SAGIPISKEAAGYLYCAISADTGSFKYPATTAHTMEVVGEIMKMGVDAAALCENLYGRKTFKQLKLQGEAINTVRLHCGGKIGTAYVSGEMYEKYNADKSDTEALAALPREIDGVVMSAFFTQRTPDEIRVNLRSKGDYDVRTAAMAFGGGGHIRAAGCTIKGNDIEAAIEAVVAELAKQLGTE
ncbi:MAG: bifunctional oligoribonuclease/PAP phosphatase NrnA, partial [Clostridia bacterium]